MTPATKAPPRTRAARQGTATRNASRRTAGRRVARPHRRVSGPARPAAATAATATLPVPPLGAFGLRVLRAGRSLQDSTLLDRLVRGRGWIVLLGVLLFGLVALNVSLLKLNAAAGHSAERAKILRIQNAKLRGKVSRLASGDRLRAAAAEQGLVMPEPKKVHYLSTRPDRDPRQASKNIRDGTALAFTDDLVSATPAIDAELVAPTPPEGSIPPPTEPGAETAPTGTTPAPATGTTTPAAGTATTPAPDPGTGTTPAPQPTVPAGG